MTPEKLERSYLHIAASVFGPDYLSKWESNKQKTDGERTFW